jgi:uncharacterized protein (TIGR03086 family)
MTDIQQLHRRAAEASVAAVSRSTPTDLDRPTPCGEWALRDLLAHMIVQNHGFVTAAEGGGADLAIWQVGPLGPDPVAEYAVATDRVVRAFSADDILQRPFALPEISPDVTFPGAQAVGFHFVDCVVHGWDVARSLDIPYALDHDLLAAALPIAEAVPEGERRLQPGASFRPGLSVQDAAAPLDRILLLLGRSPSWPH